MNFYKTQNTIKVLVITIVTSLSFFNSSPIKAQCGFPATCSNTDYSNFGINSNSNAATIEYDNFVAGFHQTATRTSQGVYKVWGEYMGATEYKDVLIPTDLDNVKYPDLTGTVLKVTLGGDGTGQAIILTTSGLFAMGYGQYVLPDNIYNSGNFTKLTIDGQTDGLPAGVDPLDVKMLFGTADNLVLVTCSGNVYIITDAGESTGTGISGYLSDVDASKWYQVTESTAGNPVLSNVVAVRGSKDALFALKADGSLWTWGKQTYLGNNTAKQSRTRATQMTSPTASPIKMIGGTMQFVAAGNENHTYYALAANGSLYALGGNSVKQIGDFTTTERLSWVQPRYTSAVGPVMNNVKWISPNEHDDTYATINILTSDSLVYNWGYNSSYMLGRSTQDIAYDPGMPNGMTNADKIIGIESGGHTTMLIRKCENNFGYVGHSVSGSMGNGGSADTYEQSFTFSTAAVSVCGAAATAEIALTATPVVNSRNKYCNLSSVGVTGIPAGGTFSVSGPATYNSNLLSFTGPGNTIPSLKYTVTKPGCSSPVSVTRIFNTADCSIAATDDVASTTPSKPVLIKVLSNDDAGNYIIDNTSVTIISNPSHGSVSIDPVTGEIIYTPTTGYIGTDSFVYQMCDNGARCDQATVFITVSLGACDCLKTCSNTDYSNYGMNSNSDAATIEYDNLVSGFHQTATRTSQGVYKVWGESMGATEYTDVLIPTDLDNVKYPDLTGKVLKVTLGGDGTGQAIILTTTGLFAMGYGQYVLPDNIYNSGNLTKLTIDGQIDGLPVGVDPLDVKMLFATADNLVLVTCSGNVYIITDAGESTGTGISGLLSGADASKWYQVTESTGGNPVLSNVVAARGSKNALFALKADGTLWTWGTGTYLGNNTAKQSRTRATQMRSPSSSPIKMIGGTKQWVAGNEHHTYYVLDVNGNLYALGSNINRQIGDFTTTERLSWAQPKYSATGPVMNNVKWISPNEHDATYASINILTTDSLVYNWGWNSSYMLGRPTDGIAYDPGMPNGITNADKIMAVESGGHTTMLIKKCENNFGYVGHSVSGSMGNGGSADAYATAFSFSTAAVSVCGAVATAEIALAGIAELNYAGKYCNLSSIGVSGIPTGGTFSVTGPATYNSNLLSFTGPSNTSPSITYTVRKPGCPNPVSITRTFNTVKCDIVPLAVADGTATMVNTSVTGNAGTNDSEVSGGTFTLGTTTAGTGTLTMSSTTGQYTFTPAAGFTGTSTTTYTLCNGIPVACSSAVITVTVYPTLVANPDVITTTPSVSTSGTLTTNDGGVVPGATFTVSITQLPPSTGTISINPTTGQYTFTPNSTFTGSTTTTYTICNTSVNPNVCSSATITIDVLNVPVAVADGTTTIENTPVSGHAGTNDSGASPSLNPVFTAGTLTPGTGTFIMNPSTGQFTYTPSAGFTGTTAVTYTLCNLSSPPCSTTTITFTVLPTLEAKPDVIATTPGVSTSGTLTTNDGGVVPGATYTVSITQLPPSTGTITINPSTGQYTFTPNSTFTGSATTTYTICNTSVNPNVCSSTTITIAFGSPQIAVAKTVLSNTKVNSTTCQTVFSFNVSNLGNAIGNNVQLVDNLNKAFPSPITYTVVGLNANSPLTVNSAYDGNSVIAMLSGTNSLNASQSAIVTLTVNFTLNTTTATVLSNSGVGSTSNLPDPTGGGTHTSVDTTNAGTNPDPDGDGNPNEPGENVPTEFKPIHENPETSEFNIPQGFSPNGDGVNDVFVIRGILNYPNNKFTILNRWGNVVFEKEGYDNTWDGRATQGVRFGGDDLPDGTYFYILDLGNGEKPYKGYIYISKTIK